MNEACTNTKCPGYITIVNGDNDVPCVCPVAPAPVVVEVGVYKASVTKQGEFFHLRCDDYGWNDLFNVFVGDHDRALAIGIALLVSCPALPDAKTIGYTYFLGSITNMGSIELKGEDFKNLPSSMSQQAGREIGLALIQMGTLMKLRREAEARPEPQPEPLLIPALVAS